MSVVLPNTLNYSQQLPALPECQSFSQTVSPINGSTFGPSSIIQFDLGSRGFIDPQSIYLRYKFTVYNNGAAAVTPTMIGTPFYTVFQRFESIVGSIVIESINQYNQVANLLMNTQFDTSQKYGLQSGLGFTGTEADPAMSKMDGRTFAQLAIGSTTEQSASVYFSGQLIGSLLTNSEKLIPAFAMPSIRIQLTVDSIANMFAVAPTNIQLSNLELCYSMIDFGREVENMVLNMGPKIYIKSQSYSNSVTPLATGTNGQISMVYNQRFASIKSAFILFAGASSTNKWGDAFDPTSSNGDITLQVGGVNYPQRSLSFLNNKGGILSELRRAVGSMYDRTNAMSINLIEFNKQGSDNTTIQEPAKMYIGIDLEKLNTKGALLTGISSQNSPITVLLNTGTATTQTYNTNLILNYDALIELDVLTKQVSVKQ